MKQHVDYAAITQSLWLNAAKISRHLDNSLGAVHGIGLSEFMVLLSLMQAPGHALRRIDIAESLGRTASGVTRMLLPMEKTGLVARESNARDARVSLVKITGVGEELFENASVTLENRSQALLRNLDEAQARELLALLMRI